MVQKRFHNYLICCFIFLVCLFTTACSSNDTNSNEATLSGSAIKGIISDGIVSAYRIVNDHKELLTQTRTDQLGQFHLDIQSESFNQLILLELSTDPNTRMRCDLTTGCIDQNSGELVNFGEDITLPSFFKLFGVAGNPVTSGNSAFISPLTHLVVATAKNIDNALTSESINVASEWVKSALKLESSPLQVQLKDITQLEHLPIMTDEELKQSIIAAAMYSDTIENNWANGNKTLDSIDLKAIILRAANLTNDLSGVFSESGTENYQANSLNRIQSQLDLQSDQFRTPEITILSQPSSVDIAFNQSLTLYVQANSTLNLNYQWFKNNEAIPGATSALYSKTNSDFSDTGIYSVLISHEFSEIMSLSATVNINEPSYKPEITQQPKSLSITQGDPILLSVETNSSTEPHYQWQKNGSLIPGATGNTYFIANSSLSDQGNYRVTVSNNKGEVSSNFVNVWVTEKIEPVSILTQPKSTQVSEGESANFTVEVNGDGFIRYQWRKNGVPIENEYSASLTIPSVSILNEGSYDVIVMNSQGSIQSHSADLLVLPSSVPITITKHPISQSIETGQPFTLSVSATGGDLLNYQWFLNGEAIDNEASSSLNIASANLEHNGNYSVLVSNEYNSQHSETSTVHVNLPAFRSLELTWDTPTEREDGSPLSFDEIKGYVIEYGQNESKLEHSIMVENQLPNKLVLDNIEPSTLLLRIATIDSDGLQGTFSEMIWVTLQ